jgi:hypothetical protein
MKTTPTTTVKDKLFVVMAMITVGISAATTLQSIMKWSCSIENTCSTTNAVRMQTGTKESHFNTTSGNLTLLTNINGRIRGIKVTTVHPMMIRKVDRLRFI